ncbi:MAG: hypothetical protein ACETVP_05685 [Candidatus Bathyarchaeia archaeon]
MHIVVSKFGKVRDEEMQRVIEVMEECYNRLAPHDVAIVDLYYFERSSSVDAFLAKESAEVGVVSKPFDELFFAMHDAWRGTSRIILCLERMERLPRLVRMGGIRHEVGHSVLHGSLRYYLLSLPPELLDVSERFNLSLEYATNLLYLISIAVKDYEVSRLLHERGYVEDQVAYVKHVLAVSESDVLSWKISREKPLAEVLCLISYLKTASCAVPFLLNKTFGEAMRRRVTESLSHFPAHYSTLLMKTALEGFSSMGVDTLNNIDHVTRLIAENIINPILRG